MRLNLIVLYCTDLERSAEYYSRLGLELIPEQHGKGPQHYSCTMGDVVLELYPRSKDMVTEQAVIVGFQVSRASEVVAEIAGTPAEVGVVKHGDAMISLRDPDGNKVFLSFA